jgi:Centromere DNA-binding protein complex CBF3 subunit, domain 2/Transcriptional activator of glycolytic enzymes
MAFYLFVRFVVKREPWPDFSDTVKWQQIKLLRNHRNSRTMLSYSTHNTDIKKAFDGQKVQLNMVTHVGRKTEVQLREALDVPDAQIRRLSHWNATRMARHYSSGIARQGARMFAGHGSEAGHYYLAREAVAPSEELRRKVFPKLQESLKYLLEQPPDSQDMAGVAFLRAMEFFETVIIEDAVPLKKYQPDSPLWDCELFRSPEFKLFELRALRAQEVEAIPREQQMRQLWPEMVDQIVGMKQMLHTEVSSLAQTQRLRADAEAQMHARIEEEFGRLQKIETFVDELRSGNVQWVTRLMHTVGDKEFAPLTPLPSRPSSSGGDTQSFSATTSTTLPHPSSASTDDPVQNEEPPIPVYEVNQMLESVDQVWEEWDRGLVNGPNGSRSPSINELETRYGTKWRKDPKLSKRFSRRKLFIARLKLAATNLNLPVATVAHKMELWRQRQKNVTIDKIQKLIGTKEPWGVNDAVLKNL